MNNSPEPIVMYGSEFYGRQFSGSLASAHALLEIVFDLYKPVSVVDFGCGRGAWLAAAQSFGSKLLKGYDGPWVKNEVLESKDIDFTAVRLDSDFQVDRRYELAISVEVAEHLPANAAKSFIEKLCKASDVIVFGAAVKGQGGVNHINEQPQSYWIKLFADNGYDVCDIFRSTLWNNDQVDFWYRQNTFLFVNGKAQAFDTSHSPVTLPYDIVHPLLLAHKTQKIQAMKGAPTFSFCLNVFKTYMKNRLLGNGLQSLKGD